MRDYIVFSTDDKSEDISASAPPHDPVNCGSILRADGLKTDQTPRYRCGENCDFDLCDTCYTFLAQRLADVKKSTELDGGLHFGYGLNEIDAFNSGTHFFPMTRTIIQ